MNSLFQITFLGTGTSIGVPVIGCDCAVCTSDDPINNRTRSSIHIQTPELSLVVDTGPDFRDQCLREKITHLDAVLFTHAHSDHIMGFDDLRRFTVAADANIDIYGHPETLTKLRTAFDYVFNGENHYVGYLKPVAHEIDGSFSLGDLEVTPLPVTHGKVDTIGFLFSQSGKKRLAYIPDAKTLSPETTEAIRDVEVLILDALHDKPHPTHLSTSESIEIAQQANAAQTWFTHFSCRVDHTIVAPTLPDGIQLSWDGLKISSTNE